MTEAMDATAFRNLKELLSDAETCARLSKWEEQFLDSMRERVLQYGVHVIVSAAQREALGRIEAKVYA